MDLSKKNGIKQNLSFPTLSLLFHLLIEFSASVIRSVFELVANIPQHIVMFVQNLFGVDIPCTTDNSVLVDYAVIFAQEFSILDSRRKFS